MKCHLCDQKFVIETDPKACDYKLVSGVKKKNEEWDPEEGNVIPLPDDQEKARLETDPIFRLEHTAEVIFPTASMSVPREHIYIMYPDVPIYAH